MSKFQSVPQNFPILDSKLASSWSFGLAQGLPVKQLLSGAHSSPFGQGKLFAQSLAWSSHEMPQKLVLNFDGDGVIGAFDGDDVDVCGTIRVSTFITTGLIKLSCAFFYCSRATSYNHRSCELDSSLSNLLDLCFISNGIGSPLSASPGV